MKYAVRTQSLTKRFGTFTALDSVSLQVRPGEIYAFLGLNGAGKTTCVRAMLGLISADEGELQVLDEDVSKGKGPWEAVGSMVESPTAYPELSVLENLDIFRKLRGLPKGRSEELIEELKLNQYIHKKAGELSLGNKQRLGLAKAMIHRPKLLILDEPANALDPAGIVELRRMLSYLAKEEGVSVFISSHLLGEVSLIADRLGIIHQGRLLKELSADELRSSLRRVLEVESTDDAKALETLRAAGYEAQLKEGGGLELRSEQSTDKPQRVAELIVKGGTGLKKLYKNEERLEDFFLRIIEDEK